ncbi:50S ribosomal protein L9 [Plasmodium brasilianum]|uniref:50S ribosomal protein L9, mitochondrial, putative n=3 Tax=Plasmodium (Plasmodium) TaxID=418103 RepID=A0A1D3SMD2_PLAMA|nr:50S ribosomal protein L9, mitochondrial, putative [Plasmodium malariae]KAI4837094.1 50S ribosomal protein L9 [Plasmodium brasilianum]SCO92977.1 50S ribosomal protein L9, mitochondrial, putative [Plasmodium malariae]
MFGIKAFLNLQKFFMSSYLNYNKYTIKRKTYIAAVESKYTYIVLLNNVSHIGEKGEIIKVKRGYARNLIKDRRAVYATYENIDSYADKEKYKRTQQVHIKKGVEIKKDFEKYFTHLKNIDITIYLDVYKYTNDVSYNLYDFFNYVSNNYELDLTCQNLHKINYYKTMKHYNNNIYEQIYSDISNPNDLIIQNNVIFKYTGIYVIYYFLFMPNAKFLNEILFRIGSLQEYEMLKSEKKDKKMDIVYKIN